MANADGLRGAGEFGGRQPIDPVIGFVGDLRAGMGDAGEMHHGLDALEQCAPLDRAGQVGHRDHLDRARKDVGGLAHRGPHRMARARQIGHQGAADEARRAGDQDPRHGLPRAKLQQQPADQTAAPASAIVAPNRPRPQHARDGKRDQRHVDGKHAGDDLPARCSRGRSRADRNACGAPARTVRGS